MYELNNFFSDAVMPYCNCKAYTDAATAEALAAAPCTQRALSSLARRTVVHQLLASPTMTLARILLQVKRGIQGRSCSERSSGVSSGMDAQQTV